MDRWSPECLTVRLFPSDRCREGRAHVAAEPRCLPIPVVPFPDLTHGRIAIAPSHAGYGHPLLRHVTRIGADEQVEGLLGIVKHDAEISVAPREVSIL